MFVNKMHQILNDNTMFQVVSDLYTGVIPVQDNKPVIDQETYKKVLESKHKKYPRTDRKSTNHRDPQVYCWVG